MTRRLIEVCRQRDTPIITFVNKMDREVRDPLDIFGRGRARAGHALLPHHLAGGPGQAVRRHHQPAHAEHDACSTPAAEKRPQDFEVIPLAEAEKLRQRFGQAFDDALESMELAVGASAAWNHEQFLAAKLTPVFFGSGVNNFGVQEVLNAVVDMSPPPGTRLAYQEVNRQRQEVTIRPEDKGFAGVVFKVQANMDANHRDRIAFVRVASGKYTPGMKMKVQRTGKELRPTSVVTFMSQRREAVDEAYAGDIIGFTIHGGVQLGDPITDGPNLQFTGLPFFAPEMFMTVVLNNPLRSKQLQAGPDGSWAKKAPSRCSSPMPAATCCWAPWASCSLKWCSTASKPSTTATSAWKAASTPARAGSRPTPPPNCASLKPPTRCAWRTMRPIPWPSSAPAPTTCAWRRSAFRNPLPSAARACRAGAAGPWLGWPRVPTEQ